MVLTCLGPRSGCKGFTRSLAGMESDKHLTGRCTDNCNFPRSCMDLGRKEKCSYFEYPWVKSHRVAACLPARMSPKI